MEPNTQTATQAAPATQATPETPNTAPVVNAPAAPVTPVKRLTAREIAIQTMRENKAAEPKVDLNATVTVEETPWNMDAFMSEDFTGDPIMDTTHKDLPDYKTILSRHVDENGRKLIANLRSDYTRKTQEIAGLRKQLEAERAQLKAEREMLLTSEAAKANAAKAAIDTSKLDPYVEADMDTLLEAKAAKLLEKQLQPIQERYQRQVQEQEANAFIAAHPELNEPAYKAAMIDVLKTKPHLGTEDAFEIAKARVVAEQAAKATEAKELRKATGREYLASPNGRKAETVQNTGKRKSARDIYLELSRKG